MLQLKHVPLLSFKETIDIVCQNCGQEDAERYQSLIEAAEKWRVRENWYSDHLDENQQTSIELYKIESDLFFHRTFDRALAVGDVDSQDFIRHLPFMKLLLTALYKLPLDINPLLLCGVPGSPSLLDFKTGDTITWWQLVFTTTDSNFRTKYEQSRPGLPEEEILFYMLDAPAVDVTLFGEDCDREELIVLPGTTFSVEGIHVHSKVTTVLLKFKPQPQQVDFAHPAWRKVMPV